MIARTFWLPCRYVLADAGERARSISGIVGSPGLLLMVAGQATMTLSALTASFLRQLGNLVTDTVE
jgi:hypothetical protein